MTTKKKPTRRKPQAIARKFHLITDQHGELHACKNGCVAGLVVGNMNAKRDGLIKAKSSPGWFIDLARYDDVVEAMARATMINPHAAHMTEKWWQKYKADYPLSWQNAVAIATLNLAAIGIKKEEGK